MNNIYFKIIGKCKSCKKNRLFIRRRKVKIPVGGEATSHDLLCNACYNKLVTKLNSQSYEL